MLDIGWQEIFLIGIVALIAIGPKDLPRVMRTLAGLIRKARALSQEFQSGIAEMMREAELDELRDKLKKAGEVDVGKKIKDAVDPTGSLSAEFDPAEFNRELMTKIEREQLTHRDLRASPAASENGTVPIAAPEPPAGTTGADETENKGR